MKRLLFSLICTIYALGCVAVNSTDDWTTVNETDIYQKLDDCAKQCVETVNDRVWDVRQQRFCQSYGCVCSENTQGPNFLAAQSNVTSCAAKACNSTNATDDATQALDDLCLVHAVNLTQPAPEAGMRDNSRFDYECR